jgi:toxin FitB
VSCLIDTNIISEIRKGPRCDPRVAEWFASIDSDDVYLSVLVLRKGIERARAKEPAKARALESWLKIVREAFGSRILLISEAVADDWGRMGAKRPVPTVDAPLAATAKVHRLSLAARDAAAVADLGVDVIDPFQPRSASEP